MTKRERLEIRRKKWLDALRSGKYKQGVGQLRTGNRFCCLGVACEVYRTTRKDGSKWDETGEYFKASKCYLPGVVQEYFGLKDNRGRFKGACGGSSLSVMNDDTCSTFKDIANIIEANRNQIFE